MNQHAAVVAIILGLGALAIAAIIYGAWLDARAWRRALEQSGYAVPQRKLRGGGRDV